MGLDGTSLLDQPLTQAWLNQFRIDDQPRAAALLSKFVLVSRDEFATGLRDLVSVRSQRIKGPIALYAEREVRHRLGKPHRLFKESRIKVRRAEGIGPKAVEPTKAYDQSVGSEGLVAQLITELCRENPKKFVSHPGPDTIRMKKVRGFFVLTDLIASGERANSYLSAAWQVRSVRSWGSWGLLKFEVIAYAGTTDGTRVVQKHRCRPTVSSIVPCPTVRECFPSTEANRMAGLCVSYDPVRPRGKDSLGYGNIGALIAFAHGAPNNVPRIFHKTGRGSSVWTPLFPSRVTAGVAPQNFGRSFSASIIEHRLKALGQKVLARSPAALYASDATKRKLLLLAALLRRPRLDMAIAERTGLTTIEVGCLCTELESLGWIDSRRHLTDRGYGELLHARAGAIRQAQSRSKEMDHTQKVAYYPTSLRSPYSKV
ncbi:phosphoribosyltransferase-like protein [Methylobacter luteus]